jgi:hypothetical protein
MEFDRIIENVYEKLRYALKVIYKGNEYLYKEGDDLDEEIAEAIFAEKEIRLRFIDVEIDVIVFHGRHILELDLRDPNIQEGLKKDGLHLEIVDLLTRGLKGDAKDTWSDILESEDKQSNLDIKIKLSPKTRSKIWKETAKVLINNSIRGFFGSNNGFESFRDTGYALGFDIPGISNDTLSPDRQQLLQYILKKIRAEKVLQGLKDDARDTWSDILESKESFHVVCTRGPYWLPDEDPVADEHFGYDCLINGNKIIIGEEPADGFRYVYEADKKTYDLYAKDKKDIMPLIKKAIELHELKKGLKGSAPDTWEDILS